MAVPGGEITIHYGDLPVWRAEICRIALRLGDVPFSDRRYHPYFGEEMMSAAKEAASGNAPWIEVDGRTICQTAAISRYCATRAGMTPTDLFLASRVDESVQCCTDWSESLKSLYQDPDPQKWRDEHGKKWLSFFQKRLQETDTGLLVGDTLTIADIAVWRLLGMFLESNSTGITAQAGALLSSKFLAEHYPRVKAHYDLIDGHPRICAYMATQYPEGKGVNPIPGFDAFGHLQAGEWWTLSASQPATQEAAAFWESHGEPQLPTS